MNQTALARSLDAVVEDCVNHVGVDVNTASAPLLERVSGLSAGVAGALVRHREAHGAFASRRALKDVPGLGAKTFEQCAGFLRIRGGADPLDESGVHPESYPVVARMLQALGKPMGEVLGKPDLLRTLKPAQFVVPPDLEAAQASPGVGLATINDIVAELEKPGRDPRGQFKVARFNDGVNDIKDLQPGMLLEGTVSNVAQFGAFVDLGVHQDGLVHVSQLSHAFTTDARSVVKTGDIVKVQVVEVDVARKRIALTMKIGAKPAGTGGAQPGARGGFAGHGARGNAGGRSGQGSGGQAGGGQGAAGQGQRAASAGNTAMGSAFEKLLKR